MDQRNYHHGNLRAALIEQGLRLLAEREVEAVSLREVARAAGVSATSVYRHFPDKDALMRALAREGLDRLAAAQREAAAQAGGGDAGFAATGRAYVRFALANPALFRLIFTSSILACNEADGVGNSDASAFLKSNAAALAARQGGTAAVYAAQAWALAHGLAMLMLDGQLPPDDVLIDQAIGSHFL